MKKNILFYRIHTVLCSIKALTDYDEFYYQENSQRITLRLAFSHAQMRQHAQ